MAIILDGADSIGDLGDALNAKLTTPGAWTDFTPTWSTSGGTTIAATVSYARYTQIGKNVFAQVSLVCTTGGGSGYFRATLPVAVAGATRIIGSFMYTDSGTAFYSGTCLMLTSTQIVLAGYNTADYLGGVPAITAAAGDVLRYSVNYEVA
jgi:hypothetical protein